MEFTDDLALYLCGEVSLDEFRDWFDAATWDAPLEDPIGELVGQIELLMAEFSNGHRTEVDLRNQLYQIASSSPLLSACRLTISYSAATTITVKPEFQFQSADIEFAAVSV